MITTSRPRVRAAAALLLLTSLAGAAVAQSRSAHANGASRAPADAPEEDEDGATRVEGVDVVVRKDYAHQVGAVVGDITPELQLGPADIRTYGVATVTELLGELAPETRSERGRGGGSPVVLLNGRRISGLGEVLNIPTEAILRIDILPEEAALKYGYAADQRVVNIVLRRRFRAVTGDAGAGGPTEGGQARGRAEIDVLRIRRDDRLNLDLKYAAATGIAEAARGVAGFAGRDLAPATQSLTLNTVVSRPLPGGVGATLNATLGATSSDLALGQPPATPSAAFAHQVTDAWTAHLGSTFNKDKGGWRLSLTDAYDHADTQTDTDALGPRPPGTARTISDDANIQVLANGPLLKLPAGRLYLSAKAGDAQSWQSSKSDRSGAFHLASLSRNDASGRLNIDLPLTSRKNRVAGFLGDLSISGNGAVDRLSDFAALTSVGYGVNWTPLPGYTLIVSHTDDQAAPTVQQLGGAMISTPGVRLYDFATGQTVTVTQVSGGAPDLRADRRSVLKIGLTVKPLPNQDLTLTANYTESDIENPILTFPTASPQIQAAFPSRFVRDASGAIIEEDLRPVNFARSQRSEIRWGLSYSRPVGKQPPPRAFPRGLFRRTDGGAAGRGQEGAAAGGPRRFGGGGAGFPVGGRLQFAVYHTLYLTDRELVRVGGPTLDLLNGAAASSTGGQPRNEIEAQLGLTLAGLGARLSADWREGTHVQASPGSPGGDLAFSDLTTLNLRLFENLTQRPAVIKRYPWLRGARLTVEINNLLDERVGVRDALGVTPLGYQSAYLDPAGRTILVSFRKLFF